MSHDRRAGKGPADDFSDLQDAMDVWREDTERTAARVDVHGELADRVVAAALRGAPHSASARSGAPPMARWYAAAAVLLISVGVAGTVITHNKSQDAPSSIPRWAMMEQELIDIMTQDPALEPGLGR